MGVDRDRVLKVVWSKKENDFMIHYPRRCDGHLIQGALFGTTMRFDLIKYNTKTLYDQRILPYEITESLRDELEKRGYDLTTLKFSIELKKDTNEGL